MHHYLSGQLPACFRCIYAYACMHICIYAHVMHHYLSGQRPACMHVCIYICTCVHIYLHHYLSGKRPACFRCLYANAFMHICIYALVMQHSLSGQRPACFGAW